MQTNLNIAIYEDNENKMLNKSIIMGYLNKRLGCVVKSLSIMETLKGEDTRLIFE